MKMCTLHEPQRYEKLDAEERRSISLDSENQVPAIDSRAVQLLIRSHFGSFALAIIAIQALIIAWQAYSASKNVYECFDSKCCPGGLGSGPWGGGLTSWKSYSAYELLQIFHSRPCTSQSHGRKVRHQKIMCDYLPDDFCTDMGVIKVPYKFGDEDVYSSSSANAEEAWRALGGAGMTVITGSEMSHLPGSFHTARLQADTEQYVVLVDVFHQLHCLASFPTGIC